MKMVYERPVMRVEVYQANDYVAACNRVQTTEGKFLSVYCGENVYYFTTSATSQTNLNSGQAQYYFNEYNGELGDYTPQDGYTNGNDGGIFYLEYSAHMSSANNPAYYLYQENASSGYGASSLDATGAWWNRTYSPSENATVLVSGANSLQMNNGKDGWALREGGKASNKDDWWYSDTLLGKVSYDEETVFKYTMST